MDLRNLLIAVVIFFTGIGCSKPAEITEKHTYPIKLGTFTEPKEHGVTDLFIGSPWNPNQCATLGFPEHCWGINHKSSRQ